MTIDLIAGTLSRPELTRQLGRYVRTLAVCHGKHVKLIVYAQDTE